MQVKAFNLKKNEMIYRDSNEISKIPDLCLVNNETVFSPLTKEIFLLDKEEFEKTKLSEKKSEYFPKDRTLDLKDFVKTRNNINIFLTTNCNLRCIYCYASGGEERSVINFNFVKKAIDTLSQNKDGLSMSFHGGGEPSQEIEQIKKILEYAKTKFKNINASIQTNGVMSDETVDWLMKNKFNLTLSIDGPPEIQNKQRPAVSKDSSIGAERTIKRLVESNYDFGTRTTISAYSVNKMMEIVEYLYNIGIKKMHLEPLFESGRSLKSTSIYARAPNLEEYKKQLLKVIELSDEYGMTLHSTLISASDGPRISFCGAAGDNLSLTTDGYITSCHEAPLGKFGPQVFIYGKYNEETDEIEIDEKKLDYLRNRTLDNMPSCDDCYIKWDCAGDCLIKAFHEKGDMYKINKKKCDIKRELTKRYLIYKSKKELMGWKPTVTKNKVLKMFFDEIKLQPIKNNQSFNSNAYIEIELNKINLSKLAEQMKNVKEKNKWKPMLFVLNFNLNDDELTVTNGKKIIEFLETLQKNKIRYKITTPLGYCMLGSDYEQIIKKLKIPKEESELVIDANIKHSKLKKCSSCIYRMRKKCGI